VQLFQSEAAAAAVGAATAAAPVLATPPGDLEGVQWLIQQGASVGPSVSWAAAAGGHTHVLALLASLEPQCAFDETTCRAAAGTGQLETLRWLRALKPEPCPWNASTCEAAAAGGHIEVGALRVVLVGGLYTSVVKCCAGTV
jgi:hypothetical protein